MIVTRIEMSKVKDKKKPLDGAVWNKATAIEESKIYNLLSSLSINIPVRDVQG
tara:strand:- start:20616 stop:20774 length:159 start_codon:yes stop_codon:yes gene_type:complete